MSNDLSAANATLRLKSCPVCLSSRLEQLADVPSRWIGGWLFERYRGRLGLSECRDCKLVFVNPRPSSRLLSEFYRSDRYVCHRLDDPASMLKKADHLLDRLDSSAAPNPVLLDYGCGSGWLVARARERGWNAVGFDVGQSALQHCRERGLPVVPNLDELADHSCDALVMHHVLEHVENFEQLFGTIRRVLKPSGQLLVEVPNVKSLRARLSLSPLSRHYGFDERYRAFPIHLSYFSGGNLSLLLERHGFKTSSVGTYGVGLDELFWDPESEQVAYAGMSGERGRSRRLQPLKEVVKRAIYENRLGENLLVTAQHVAAVTALEEAQAAE